MRMKSGAHKRKVVWVIAGLCVIFAFGALVFWSGEPEYKGKKLSEWIDSHEAHPKESEEAVTKIGTNAIPILVKWLQSDRHGRRNKRIVLAAKFPLWIGGSPFARRWIGPDETLATERAYYCFGIFGPDAASAVPELVRIVRGSLSLRTQVSAGHSLMYLGKDALPPMLEILADSGLPLEKRFSMASSIGLMGYLGSNAVPAVPVLLECAGGTNEMLQRVAASILWNYAREVAPPLPKGVAFWVSKVPDAVLRRSAVAAIGQCGTNVNQGVLSQALNDSDALVRAEATNALSKIEAKTKAQGGDHL